MSIHKLTAGSGYDYLTRQVAAHDATERGHGGLASYYAERGESPGVWVGAGLDGIEGLAAGDAVSAEQMQALFGSGHHPLAHARRDRLAGPDLSAADYRAVTRLGQPYKVYPGDVSPFRVEVARRLTAWNEAAGLPGDWPVPVEQRARIRTEIGAEFFRREHGRDPSGPRELAAAIARHCRPKTTAVAGYDLTFSPVKSVSALWALADPGTAARIERAHQDAVREALAWIERHALFTRTGTNGVRQVEVTGLVAAAFTHRDSRAGDPDLHTHVAVANKVQTLPDAHGPGRWLSIDGRVLFQATVGASEVYNTALEQRLIADLGTVFAERAQLDPRKRPVREIVGVPAELNARWSARRVSIQARRGELAAAFQARHGRPPTPVESIKLAQQATLETRQAKHEPRTLTEQRAAWAAQAEQVLGGPDAVAAMVRGALARSPAPRVGVDRAWVAAAAGPGPGGGRVPAGDLAGLARAGRGLAADPVGGPGTGAGRDGGRGRRHAGPGSAVCGVVPGPEVADRSRGDGVVEPAPLRRRDGSSVYEVAGATRYTSARILAAEQRLLAAAARRDGPAAAPGRRWRSPSWRRSRTGCTLNAGQVALVRAMATSPARLQLAIAPAGTGKTTAMRALAHAWTDSRRPRRRARPVRGGRGRVCGTRSAAPPTPWPS